MEYKYDDDNKVVNRITLDGSYGVYKLHQQFTFQHCNSQKLNNHQHLKLRYVSHLTSNFTLTDPIFYHDNLNIELQIGQF